MRKTRVDKEVIRATLSPSLINSQKQESIRSVLKKIRRWLQFQKNSWDYLILVSQSNQIKRVVRRRNTKKYLRHLQIIPKINSRNSMETRIWVIVASKTRPNRNKQPSAISRVHPKWLEEVWKLRESTHMLKRVPDNLWNNLMRMQVYQVEANWLHLEDYHNWIERKQEHNPYLYHLHIHIFLSCDYILYIIRIRPKIFDEIQFVSLEWNIILQILEVF